LTTFAGGFLFSPFASLFQSAVPFLPVPFQHFPFISFSLVDLSHFGSEYKDQCTDICTRVGKADAYCEAERQ
jgi:hypothetical protein